MSEALDLNVSDDLIRIFCANEIHVLEEEDCIFLVTYTLSLVGVSNGKRLLFSVLRSWANFYFIFNIFVAFIDEISSCRNGITSLTATE